MEPERQDSNEEKQWESAHVCPQCGFSISLKDLGLKGGATGVVTCPKCDWSGPVEIQIVDREPSGQP
jgi:ribosomal protein L37AE/L43A